MLSKREKGLALIIQNEQDQQERYHPQKSITSVFSIVTHKFQFIILEKEITFYPKLVITVYFSTYSISKWFQENSLKVLMKS
jgi:hypothetical protein